MSIWIVSHEGMWRDCSDTNLMVVVERSVTRGRLVKRQISSVLCENEVKAREMVGTTDDLNAEDVLACRVEEMLEVVM